MKSVYPGYLAALLFCLPLTHTWAQSGLVEERVSDENGFIQTIGEMEQGINPDDHATEGLPH